MKIISATRVTQSGSNPGYHIVVETTPKVPATPDVAATETAGAVAGSPAIPAVTKEYVWGIDLPAEMTEATYLAGAMAQITADLNPAAPARGLPSPALLALVGRAV